MNRRQFLVVLGTTAALATDAAWAVENATTDEVLDAGPLNDFSEDKVYDQFRDQGVLLIRRGGEVFAFSPVCPHKGCKVRPQDDQSFLCKCHGSRFDPDGAVLNGPATRDLLRLQVKLSDTKHVLIRVRKPTISI